MKEFQLLGMFIYLETRWYAVPDLFDIDKIDEEQQCRFLNAGLFYIRRRAVRLYVRNG